MAASKQQAETEAKAREANEPDLWDRLWDKGETADWRRAALSQVYTRIEREMPEGAARVVDLGGGQGDLAVILQGAGLELEVWDSSPRALEKAAEAGIVTTRRLDLEDSRERREAFDSLDPAGLVIVSTEVLEHLSREARADILGRVAELAGELGAFVSVPNARLDPEEEDQHTIAFDAITFAAELREAFGDRSVRVAALGPFLLGFCGAMARKAFTLSMCLPVRDEEADIEKVLASFREVADEIVVGIDPRTADGTEAIVRRYADVVFELEDPAAQEEATRAELAAFDPHHDHTTLPPDGVHFSHVRNQTMRRCSSDYIFMTEGHERLIAGRHFLLHLDRIITAAGDKPEVFSVARQGNRQQWAFPWLCANDPARIHYVRPVHNTLNFPKDAIVVALPGIVTLHERDHDNALARATQRQAQNRETLLDDWERSGNANSLFYLGQEVRREDPEKAAEYLETFLAQNEGTGLARYQARLMVAKIHAGTFRRMRARATDKAAELGEEEREALAAEADELEERTRLILMDASRDDWTRTEHWIWLGDLAFGSDQLEQALMFYRYAGTLVGAPPFGPWWIDMDLYSFLPAQRLAMVYGHLGRGLEAVEWARKVVETLPENAPAWAFEEARGNLRQLEEACAELGLADSLIAAELVQGEEVQGEEAEEVAAAAEPG